jgi:outer membrane lipoprotein SlyB
MRVLLALLLAAFAPWSVAQLTKDLPNQPSAGIAKCADCAVVRSVRTITKELRGADTTDDARPSGLVATVPLGKGGGKAEAGSSTRIGKDAVPTSESWEIIVRMDDGRMRVLTANQRPEVREGDKVRVEPNGRLTLRAD